MANNFNKMIEVYYNNFSDDMLIDYENEIFGNKSKKKRLELEVKRLKANLILNTKKYADYYDIIIELDKLLKITELSPDLVDEGYKLVVRTQLACGMSIRLYSAIVFLKKEDELLRLKRMAGDDNGTKRYY